MSHNSHSFEALTVLDLPELVAQETALFSEPWTLTMLQYEMVNPRIISEKIITEKENFSGYYFLQIVEDEAELHNIAIAPRLQRKGYGKRMMERIFEHCLNAGVLRIFLEVRESNIAARRLYEKMEFKIVGKRKQYYYMEAEDAILYSKDLNELVQTKK